MRRSWRSVSHAEGPLVAAGRLQELHALHEHLRGEPVLLALAARRVGEVLEHDVPGVRGAWAPDQDIVYPLRRGLRARPEQVPLLPPDEVEDVEAAVHVVEGPELVQGVGHEEVLVALVGEDLGERRLVARDGLPTPQAHVVLVPLLPVPERERTDARVDPAPRRDGGNRLGIGAGETQALVGERVEVGGLYPVVAVGPDVVLPQTIDYHNY